MKRIKQFSDSECINVSFKSETIKNDDNNTNDDHKTDDDGNEINNDSDIVYKKLLDKNMYYNTILFIYSLYIDY